MKKKIIFIVIALAIIGLAVYFYFRNKKKTTTISQTGPANPSSPVTASTQSALATTIATAQSSNTGIVNPAATSTVSPNPGLLQGKYVNVIKDGSQGKAIIQYQPVTFEPKVGQSVKIDSGPYAGTYKIWYIYSGTQSGLPVRNLYLDVPYTVSGVSGTFTLI